MTTLPPKGRLKLVSPRQASFMTSFSVAWFNQFSSRQAFRVLLFCNSTCCHSLQAIMSNFRYRLFFPAINALRNRHISPPCFRTAQAKSVMMHSHWVSNSLGACLCPVLYTWNGKMFVFSKVYVAFKPKTLRFCALKCLPAISCTQPDSTYVRGIILIAYT